MHLQVWEGLVDVISGEESPGLRVPDNGLVLCLPRGVQHLELQPRQAEAHLVPEGDGGADQTRHVLTLVKPYNKRQLKGVYYNLKNHFYFTFDFAKVYLVVRQNDFPNLQWLG